MRTQETLRFPGVSSNHVFTFNAPAIAVNHAALFIHPSEPLSTSAHGAGHPIFASYSKLLQVVTVKVDRAPHPPYENNSRIPNLYLQTFPPRNQPLWRWRKASTHKALCSINFTKIESILRVVAEPDQHLHTPRVHCSGSSPHTLSENVTVISTMTSASSCAELQKKIPTLAQ